MEIDPPAAVWRGKVDAIRSGSNPPQAAGALGQIQRTRHVLEAHQNLSGMNDKNAREFGAVVDLLENELSGKEKLADKDEPGRDWQGRVRNVDSPRDAGSRDHRPWRLLAWF